MLRESLFQPPFGIGKQRFRQLLRVMPFPSDAFFRPFQSAAQHAAGKEARNKVDGFSSGVVYNLELGGAHPSPTRP